MAFVVNGVTSQLLSLIRSEREGKMRCEAWMDADPEPTITPLQHAQAEMRYWKRELEQARKRVAECREEFAAAVDRVARL